MGRLKLFIPLLVFVALAVLFYSILKKDHYDPTALPSALVGKVMPEFNLPALGEPGRVVSHADLPRQPFLLNVWATWCPTCRQEHPFFVELARQGVVVVGINYKDEDRAALQWLQDLGNPFLFNIVDTEGRLGLDLGVYGAPETYVVDAKGIIRHKVVGTVDARLWQESLQPLMQQLQAEAEGKVPVSAGEGS